MKTLHKIAAATVITAALSACAQTPKPAPKAVHLSCTVPTHKQLDVSLQEAKTQLRNRSCHYQFEHIHKQLLLTAQGDPSFGNAQKFFAFYKWSVAQGIVSKRQGMNYYNSYFKASFGNVLPNDRNVCSASASKAQIESRMRQELQNKRIGLQEIMGDRDSYFEAQRVHNELVFLIETADMACANG